MATLTSLLKTIRACEECKPHLPLGARPILSAHAKSRILIAGQAPGKRVHETGVPWDDPSGDRLRAWMGIEKPQFYNSRNIALLPMGFCYPGTGKSGDLPPRPECRALWHGQVLPLLKHVTLTLLIGQYAQDYYLGDKQKASVTETIRAWKEYWPAYMPLPHPSPRNNIWLKKNPWFEKETLPRLRRSVNTILRNRAAEVN